MFPFFEIYNTVYVGFGREVWLNPILNYIIKILLRVSATLGIENRIFSWRKNPLNGCNANQLERRILPCS
jgi:hypothetical protein